MRQLFTVRFFAAVGALVGLTVFLSAVFRGNDAVSELTERGPIERRIDLVAPVSESVSRGFAIGDDGYTTGTLQLVLDPQRTMHIVPGTIGEVNCGELDQPGKCAVLADLLGDGVVWFAIVPLVAGRTVSLPAITSLADGYATLTNGWQLPYAPVLDRTCPRDFESFSEFREELGTDFVSIYRLTDGEITDVVCTQ